MASGNRRSRRQKKVFTKLMQRKLMVIFALVLFALVGLNIRIAYITAKSGDKYARKVLSQQQYDSRAIPFRRGEILDRNGNILARSEKVYNVVLDCYAINQNEEDFLQPTLDALTAALGLDEGELRKVISSEETRDSQYQVVKRKVSMEEKQKYDEYTDLSEERKLSDARRQELENVQGVWFEEDFIRKYPFNSLASNVLGFSNDLNDGICGLESYYTDVLNGVDGREYGYLNEDSELQRTTIEPTNGKSLVSTIDVNIQQVIEKYIKEFDDTYKGGPWEEMAGHGSKNTAVIVGDPNTGEILGMATNQGFDLNDPENLEGWYTKQEIDGMTDEEYVEALNKVWSNFCVSGAFELGSTYKPIVVASALEAGATNDGAGFDCSGYLQVADKKINCDKIEGHGPENLSDVVKNSCNVGMMHIAADMGVETFSKYQDLFNFGRKTGIDLPNENAGLLYDEDTMHQVEMATNSFGQGFTASMVQEFAAFCAVVNGGNYYKPHMVKQVLDAKGSAAKDIEPLMFSQPISSKNSSLLREYLEAVVKDGTGQKAQIPGYRIGGKTGTAETLPRDEDRYIVSFIGAVPIDDPQVVIYTVVDEPNVEDQEIGGYSMEISKKILSEILPYMGIYPTEEISSEEKQSLGMQTGNEEDQNGDGLADGTGFGDGAPVPEGSSDIQPLQDTGEEQQDYRDDGITNEDLQLEY